MMAVFPALKHFLPHLMGYHVLDRTDNTSVNDELVNLITPKSVEKHTIYILYTSVVQIYKSPVQATFMLPFQAGTADPALGGREIQVFKKKFTFQGMQTWGQIFCQGRG